MANAAASTKLTSGYGPVAPILNIKTVLVSFATTATGDILIFDASNVGKENAMQAISFALTFTPAGVIVATNTIASNQITVGTPVGATNITALVLGTGA